MKQLLRQIYLSLMKRVAVFCLRYVRPYSIPTVGTTGISSLVCHEHVHMFVYMLMSFYFHAKRQIPCTIIDDGSLTSQDCRMVRMYFPGIIIVQKSDADKRMRLLLRKYPSIRAFRKKGLLIKSHLKLTDPLMIPHYKHLLYLDSDVLFVGKPTRLISWIDRAESAYLYEPEARNPGWGIADGWNFAGRAIREALHITFDERFNSGVMCLDTSTYPLSFLDGVVSYMRRVAMDRTWLAEQYALATAFSYRHAKRLGSTYKHLALPDRKVFQNASSYTCIHFAYLTKPYFFSAALKQLLYSRFFYF